MTFLIGIVRMKSNNKIKESIIMNIIAINDAKKDSDLAFNLVCENVEFFRDEKNGNLVAIYVEDEKKVWSYVSSKFLIKLITKLFLNQYDTTLDHTSASNAAAAVMSIVETCDDDCIISNRICKYDDTIYYNLTSEITISISEKGIRGVSTDSLEFLFNNSNNYLPQELPDFSRNPSDFLSIIKQVFNIDDEYALLFSVYVITALIPDINHPILCLTGDYGSGKTTAMSCLSRIISPTKKSLFALTSNISNVVSTLSNNYFVAFDNIRRISAEVADILCQAVTGGSYSKRKLYSDNDEVSIDLHSLVCLNGYAMSIDYPDLADRCLIIPLKRIEKRKTETEIKESFSDALSEILGTSFKIIRTAMRRIDEVKVDNLPRMADFAKWGYVVAECIGMGYGKMFLDEYNKNLLASRKSIAMQNPTLYAISLFMQDKPHWKGSMSDLYKCLVNAIKAETSSRSLPSSFPQTASTLSRAIGKYKQELLAVGIDVTIGRSTDRYVEIVNNAVNAVGGVASVNDAEEKF